VTDCVHVTSLAGKEASTGRRIAIKKIKVGLFKDGLDMSAIREVKYLRELRHPNVIEVRASRILLFWG
jgi:serine/threonine protein kinase